MMSADEHCAIPIDRRNQQQAAALRNIAVPFERQLYINTTELQPISFALHCVTTQYWWKCGVMQKALAMLTTHTKPTTVIRPPAPKIKRCPVCCMHQVNVHDADGGN